MAVYKIVWKRSALKEFDDLPAGMAGRVLNVIEKLAENPLGSGVKKLAGAENTYRFRTGDYRVVYSIYKNQLVIEILRVGHRKDIYRK
jgi:mRNA interferase RelE/StbE